MSAPPVVAIFGATSAIAEQVARLYARDGARLFLVARGPRLAAIAADLEVRGAAEVVTQTADLNDGTAAQAALAACRARFERIDVALLAYGTLSDQARAVDDPGYLQQELRTNFESPACLLMAIAAEFEQHSQGVIAVITSVAGLRGRKSNFVYGAAKGGLSTFLEGLRHRLHGRGVAVLDIRPGFVDTPMTAHLEKGGPLWASPDRVAADIHRAIGARRAVLYTPWFWWGIMTIIRLLPRPLFHRLKI